MDIQIGEMNTTVRTVDSQALLNPQVLEQITRYVLMRVREEAEHAERAQRERQLNPGVSQSDSENGGN